MTLSVITINYNNKTGLLKTINSVIGQKFKDFEYLIIDGNSSDGSIEVLTEYSGRVTFWISEPDTGIYNAMNKGILKAKGDYLLFLNSGDWFCTNNVLSDFTKDIEPYDIIYGNQYLYFPGGNIEENKFSSLLTFNFFAFRNSLPHQATLIKRALFSKHGLYDEQLKMVSDWKFFIMAIYKWNCTYLHKAVFIVYFNKEGISANPKFDNLIDQEQESVLKAEFPNFFLYKKDVELRRRFLFYYKYSRATKILKKLGILKKFKYEIDYQ